MLETFDEHGDFSGVEGSGSEKYDAAYVAFDGGYCEIECKGVRDATSNGCLVERGQWKMWKVLKTCQVVR